MSRSFVIEHLPEAGMDEVAHFDDDGITHETRQHNVEDILSENDSLRNDRGVHIPKGDGALHHVARIPQILWDDWVRKYPDLIKGTKKERDKRLASLINSREFSRVRTSESSNL